MPRLGSASKAAIRRRFEWLPIFMILPAAALLGLLLLYPIARGVHMSFYDVELLAPPESVRFVGFGNYITLFKRPDFWQALQVTVTYTIGVVCISYLIGLVTALLLNTRFTGRPLARTLMIIPWAVPEVVAVLIFTWMFDAQYGVINFFLIKLGIITKQLAWLFQPSLAMPAVLAVTIWKQFPVATVVLLGGLQTISEELYEAAAMDGASSWQRFLYITMPGLRPVNIVLILIIILYSFRRVTIIFTMTGGGPARATETLAIQTYLQGFKFFNLGYASAVGTVMLAVLLVFTLVYLWSLSRGREAE